ncbi:hypothetical protein GUJ93_ZPchr0008g12274 [Zizania palustris]|uniref:Uncharacterized protein n=1 Tax=Zizania palustris TaxID=103762 RepID=A0A8J5V4M2_ZIZPA|nr:hypothetical protein GUJ93_ZPchr0008g12274 [Zizania palustris]
MKSMARRAWHHSGVLALLVILETYHTCSVIVIGASIPLPCSWFSAGASPPDLLLVASLTLSWAMSTLGTNACLPDGSTDKEDDCTVCSWASPPKSSVDAGISSP